jgi:hypothetical protein
MLQNPSQIDRKTWKYKWENVRVAVNSFAMLQLSQPLASNMANDLQQNVGFS